MASNAKAAVTGANAGDEVLGCFWKLSSTIEEERVVATQKLVELVSHSQQEFETEQSDVGERACSPLVVYAVERLVGGLGSGRRPSHIGFSAALVTLLREVKGITLKLVWEAMKVKIEVTGGMRGEQFRDAAIGRVLCCSALIQSGTLTSEEDMVMEVCKELTAIYNRKAALRQICSALIVELLELFEPPKAIEVVRNWSELHGLLHDDPEDAEPEALYLSLCLMPVLPEDIRLKCKLLPSRMKTLPIRWQLMEGCSSDSIAAAQIFFTTEHLTKLEDCLKRSSHCHPQMHSVWKPILNLLLPGHRMFIGSPASVQSMENPEQLEKPLSTFWCKFLVPVLLGSIEERQYLVHRIFQVILPHVPCQHLHLILGDEFIRRVVRQSESSEDTMHLSAAECVKSINQHLQNIRGSMSAGLNILMLRRLAKHKPFKDVCSYVLANTDKQEMNSHIAGLLMQFTHADNMAGRLAVSSDDEEPTAGNHTFSLMKASREEVLCELERAGKEVEWSFAEALEVSQFLIANGMFRLDPEIKYVNRVLEQSKLFNHQVSNHVKKQCCQHLISMLPLLQWAVSKSGIDEEMLLKMINQFITDNLNCEGVDLVSPPTPEDDNCRMVLREITAHLSDIMTTARAQTKRDTAYEKRALAMLLLCSTMNLYHWLVPESVEKDLVDDIPGIVVAAFGGTVEEISDSDSDIGMETKENGLEAKDDEMGTGDMPEVENPDDLDVSERTEHYTGSLVDLILSINTRSTVPLKPKLLRDQAHFACCSFASEITFDGWLEIFAAMKQSLQQREVADVDDEEESDLENNDVDDSGGSESGEGEISQGIELKAEEISEASDSDEDDDDEAPDDEAMFRMDAALAAVFRSRKEQKERQKQDAVSFITTTLACVKHLLKYEQTSPATVVAAAEIADLIYQIKEREGFGDVIKMAEACAKLGLKCRPGILREMVPLVEERVMKCLQLSAKDKMDKSLRKLVGQSLKFMVRCLLKADEASGVRMLRTIVNSFFGSVKSKLEFSALIDLISETRPLCLSVLQELVGFAMNSRTSFLQLQAMRLVSLCLSPKESDSKQVLLKASLAHLHDCVIYAIGSPFKEKMKNMVAISEAIKIVKLLKRVNIENKRAIELIGKESLMSKIQGTIEGVPPGKLSAKLKALEAALKLEVGAAKQHAIAKLAIGDTAIQSKARGKKDNLAHRTRPRKRPVSRL